MNSTRQKPSDKKKRQPRTKKPKIVVIKVCREEIEVDLNNPNPRFQTHCMICDEDLTPDWWKERTGKRIKIGEDAIGAACWYCSGIYTRTARQIIRDKKELRRKKTGPRVRMTKKKEAMVQRRAAQLNRRPCGCGARGRHRRGCSILKEK